LTKGQEAIKGGYNIYPSEVEGNLADITYAKSRITPFKCPSRVTFIEALPKTLVGKVQNKLEGPKFSKVIPFKSPFGKGGNLRFNNFADLREL
jgi:acyl-CoA synthetase (AMP-forming)/AMP-acid ligase II